MIEEDRGGETRTRPPDQLRAVRIIQAHAEAPGLGEWLELALKEPSDERLLMARVLIAELERRQHVSHRPLPAGDWAAVAAAPDQLAQYQRALTAWRQWASENPQTAAGYLQTAGWLPW